ncbi:hypothetical protein GQ43DRAFT_216399, partial [Delitschia confertaspora ATCC 74209]
YLARSTLQQKYQILKLSICASSSSPPSSLLLLSSPPEPFPLRISPPTSHLTAHSPLMFKSPIPTASYPSRNAPPARPELFITAGFPHAPSQPPTTSRTWPATATLCISTLHICSNPQQ